MADGGEGGLAASRATFALVAVLWLAAIGSAVTGLVLLVWPDGPMPPHGFGSPMGDAIVALGYIAGATVGAVIAVRKPRNPLGWIMLAAGFCTATASGASEYYTAALAYDLPGAAAIAWYGAWAWELGAALAVSFALLLFPNGRLPSPRWRVAWWFSAGVIAGLTLTEMLAPGPLAGEFRLVVNPFGLEAAPWLAVARDGAWGALLLLTAVSAAALVTRRRRAGATERAQIKWLAYAATLSAVALTLRSPALFGHGGPVWAQGLLVLAVLSFPVGFGVAVLRYRLFDIHRVVSRTVSYALLSALLGAVYTVAAVLAGRAFGPLGAGSDLAVAAATLTAAAVFRPARLRIQALVDRRFNRPGFDGALTLAAFRKELRAEQDLDGVVAALLTSVDDTLQPARAAVWLRGLEPARR